MKDKLFNSLIKLKQINKYIKCLTDKHNKDIINRVLEDTKFQRSREKEGERINLLKSSENSKEDTKEDFKEEIKGNPNNTTNEKIEPDAIEDIENKQMDKLKNLNENNNISLGMIHSLLLKLMDQTNQKFSDLNGTINNLNDKVTQLSILHDLNTVSTNKESVKDEEDKVEHGNKQEKKLTKKS